METTDGQKKDSWRSAASRTIILSAFRTLVIELSKNGTLDLDNFVHVLQQTAEAHRESGDPNRLADAIYAISLQIATSTPGPHSDTH
jgi:hypothetical protein